MIIVIIINETEFPKSCRHVRVNSPKVVVSVIYLWKAGDGDGVNDLKYIQCNLKNINSNNNNNNNNNNLLFFYLLANELR